MGSWFSCRLRLNFQAFAWLLIYMRAVLVRKWLISGLISGNLAIWPVLVLEKVLFYCFWVLREIHLRFCSKTQWQMFLLVFGRHVGAHLDGRQHGVPIQISINLGKKLLRISFKTKNCWDLTLDESLCIVNYFLWSDCGLNLLNGFDFILIYLNSVTFVWVRVSKSLIN